MKSVGGINRHVKEAEFYRTLLSRGERGERVFDIWHNEVGPHWNSSRCQCRCQSTSFILFSPHLPKRKIYGENNAFILYH